jgi:glycosyltransferase involved in cell wall biosynthesis
MPTPDVSIVVPVYNEERSLPDLVREIAESMASVGSIWEAVFVDDGSTDRSRQVLRELAMRDGRLRVAAMPRNSGQSAALAAGFRLARGRSVVTLDADLQNDPADIPRLLVALEGVAMVSGVRRNRRDDWLRRVSSRIANRVRSAALDDGVTDVGCSLKAYRREFLRDLPMFSGMHRFLPTLVRWNGARLAELDVHHRPRLHGVAKYGIGNRLFRALADLRAVRWMRSRWIPPGNVVEVRRQGPPA